MRNRITISYPSHAQRTLFIRGVVGVLLGMTFWQCRQPKPLALCKLRAVLSEQGDTLRAYYYEDELLLRWEDRQAGEVHNLIYEEGILTRETLGPPGGGAFAYFGYEYFPAGQLKTLSYYERDELGNWEVKQEQTFAYDLEDLLEVSDTYDLSQTSPVLIRRQSFQWATPLNLASIFEWQVDPFSPGDFRVESRRSFAYDLQTNPYDRLQDFRLPNGPHNVTKETFTAYLYGNGGRDTSFQSFETSTSYRYIPGGYPVEAIRILLNGRQEKETLIYDCEDPEE
ncbi:MAG: hypothetical protein AAFR61_32395 [Bacteroidota bacterium]